MKKVIIGIIAAGLLVAGSIFTIAQISHRKDRGAGHGRHNGGEMGTALHGVDLTDEQKAGIAEIKAQSRTDAEPLRQQMRDGHAKLEGLTQAGSFDQASVETLASEQGKIIAALIVQRQKARAAVFSLLTDEQKAKAIEALKTQPRRGVGRRGHMTDLGNE